MGLQPSFDVLLAHTWYVACTMRLGPWTSPRHTTLASKADALVLAGFGKCWQALHGVTSLPLSQQGPLPASHLRCLDLRWRYMGFIEGDVVLWMEVLGVHHGRQAIAAAPPHPVNLRHHLLRVGNGQRATRQHEVALEVNDDKSRGASCCRRHSATCTRRGVQHVQSCTHGLCVDTVSRAATVDASCWMHVHDTYHGERHVDLFAPRSTRNLVQGLLLQGRSKNLGLHRRKAVKRRCQPAVAPERSSESGWLPHGVLGCLNRQQLCIVCFVSAPDRGHAFGQHQGRPSA